ncbi:biotin/lipoyl-containing protein [Aeromonas enteropelogenes]|uniref:biotin/lipoyl-containing protein n=1 Tax=Aeromonas enteropelogenes TaxID=29489 RepID=UPI003BA30898
MTRCHYSALLLMVLLSEGAISEQQQRMLALWLPSINLVGRQAELCDLAVHLAKDKLGEAMRLLQQDPRLISSLLLDTMIFSRLDKPLTHTTVLLLESFASFFELNERVLNDIVYLAALILGLPTDVLTKPKLSRVFLYPYKVWSDYIYDDSVGQKIMVPYTGSGEFEVVKVMVSQGDRVMSGQSIIEVESDKVCMEIASSATGFVTDILVEVGENISTGSNLMILESDNYI